MSTRQRKRRSIGKLSVPILCGLCFAYFAFHAFHGEYGFYAKQRMAVKIAALEEELETLQAERGLLETRVSLLRPESLDRDLIDELARKTLNYVRPDDIVILSRVEKK